MKLQLDQSTYWDNVAATKTFSHEVDWQLVENELTASSTILDFGCGYGRLTNEFYKRGHKNIIGVDNSAQMIARAKSEYPEIDFLHTNSISLPFKNGSFNLIVLFAVLTCIPLDKDQKKLINELLRILKPGGLFYISDLLINSDERNLRRYNASTHQPYGTFELPEKVVLRHHSLEYLNNDLLHSIEVKHQRKFEVKTMNGNTSNAIQIIAGKPNIV